MSAPASGPESLGPRRTAQGTIVGMPPVVRAPVALGQLCSTTLRSVYKAEDDAPCSDAFHPERWSNPPPLGLAPIVPCDEPEEDEAVQVFPRLEPTPPASAEPVAAEEPEPPTRRWQGQPASAAPAEEEPVILPFRERDAAPGNRLLLLAAVASATLLTSLVAVVLLFA